MTNGRTAVAGWPELMDTPILKAKLDRIGACAAEPALDEIARSLLHAYVACLTPDELGEGAVQALSASTNVLSAIRTRLSRLGEAGSASDEIDSLGLRLIGMTGANGATRVRTDSLLSLLYPYLAPPTRQVVLDRWRDRGTNGAAARWLKAIAGDDLLFSIDAVLAYWRQSRDWRAAKLLAYRAEPALVSDLLAELIEGCEEGWLVSRGALRAPYVSDENWIAIRRKFPATYAYLCAKLGRAMSDQEALEIVEEADNGSFGDRGLAIWAIGQLGMASVLDRIWDMRPEFEKRQLRRLGIIDKDAD
jgi:hypothetical protein